MATRFNEAVSMTAGLSVSGGFTGATRSSLDTDLSQVYELHPTLWRVWDAMQTNLPSVGASDDIGLATGTFATALPYFKSQDLNAAGSVTEYMRTIWTLPPEYIDAGAFSLRFAAGMLTAVASVSATVDVEVYKSNRDTLKTGSDLVSTSATSINSTSFANKDFVVTSAGLVAGDAVDIRVTLALNSATGSSHFAAISHVEALLSIRG